MIHCTIISHSILLKSLSLMDYCTGCDSSLVHLWCIWWHIPTPHCGLCPPANAAALLPHSASYLLVFGHRVRARLGTVAQPTAWHKSTHQYYSGVVGHHHCGWDGYLTLITCSHCIILCLLPPPLLVSIFINLHYRQTQIHFRL
jgi:hypothetical protein